MCARHGELISRAPARSGLARRVRRNFSSYSGDEYCTRRRRGHRRPRRALNFARPAHAALARWSARREEIQPGGTSTPRARILLVRL